MSAYTDYPGWVRPLHGGFILVDALQWSIGHKASGLIVTVPEGFAFDVSVPVWARWLVSPTDLRHLKAAALHDWLLQDGWARMTAGGEMYEALRADDVPLARRLAMWLAVCLFRIS